MMILTNRDMEIFKAYRRPFWVCPYFTHRTSFEYIKDDYLRQNSRFEKFIQSAGSQAQVMYLDLVFCLKNSDDRKALFLVELERGNDSH